MPHDPNVQPDADPNPQTDTPTLSDFETAWGALAETWMGDGTGQQHLLLARQAMLLLDLVCHIAQTDEAATTLRRFGRSLAGFEKRYRLTTSSALERVLASQETKRQHRGAPGDGGRRAVTYIRESTEEQGRGFSPDGQRQAIARYAEEHDLSLVEEYLDFETGREVDKRPGFQQLIEDAMAHSFECVLIFHTSRFARNTIEAKRYKKLLRSELQIDVISVTQPLGADVDDPASFLSESVHEAFDEYYSVSLSFWTKMGLREKARQGLLTGLLPWGYIKGPDGIAVPDPEKAPCVLRMFELYASGQHTDRTIAEWLNVQGQRTARDRAFGADTVRDMLCNAAYCGYVSGHRDRSKTIKGLHEPIVEEELLTG